MDLLGGMNIASPDQPTTMTAPAPSEPTMQPATSMVNFTMVLKKKILNSICHCHAYSAHTPPLPPAIASVEHDVVLSVMP